MVFFSWTEKNVSAESLKTQKRDKKNEIIESWNLVCKWNIISYQHLIYLIYIWLYNIALQGGAVVYLTN